MKKRFALALVAVAIAFFAVKALQHNTPQGQAPLANVTRDTFHDFERTFNSSGDSIRLLVLLSPT